MLIKGVALFWKMENDPEVIAVLWDSPHMFVSCCWFSCDITKAGTNLASINSNLILTQVVVVVVGGVKICRSELTSSPGGHTCRASHFPAVGSERCHYVETQIRPARSSESKHPRSLGIFLCEFM